MVVPHGDRHHGELYGQQSLPIHGSGAVTPTYDRNGNLTFDGTFTYGYDPESKHLPNNDDHDSENGDKRGDLG